MNTLRIVLLITLLVTLASAQLKRNPIENCPKLAPHAPATKISELRPSDIKVIMSMGDSITAGFGIDGIEGGVYEFRGKSWSIGGDENQVTLPNFFKHYTQPHQLHGQSYGDHFVEICLGVNFCPNGQRWPQLDRLNAAQSGAWIQNWPRQFDYLMAQLKTNRKIDYKNDWKVLTVLFGANNLCRACDPNNNIYDDADAFEKELEALVSKLQTIPRLFVNAVSIFNVSAVYNLSLQSSYCEDVHDVIGFAECECAFEWVGGAKARAKMDLMATEYRNRVKKVVARTPQTDDFAFILQPMFSNLVIPDLSFLSSLDCFHPSLKAHQQIAIALWNTMLLPANKKPLTYTFPLTIQCPTNNTLLYTN